MEIDFRSYILKLKNWISEGWTILTTNPQSLNIHHLIAFLVCLVVIHFLSDIIAKIFKSFVKLCIMILLVWVIWILYFDTSKYEVLYQQFNNPTQEQRGRR